MAKFTIDQVLENIRAKFTNPDGKTSLKVSDRTVTETLTPFLSLVGDDMELTEFIEKYGQPVIDSANRNYIKDTTDFVKNYKPAPKEPPVPPVKPDTPAQPTPPATPFNMDEFIKKFSETQKANMDAVIQPLQAEIMQLKQDRSDKARNEALSAKIRDMKLDKSHQVEFDRSLKIVRGNFGADATADDLYEAALKDYNECMTAKGEQQFVPLDSSNTGGGLSSEYKSLVDSASKSQDSGKQSVKDALGLNK